MFIRRLSDWTFQSRNTTLSNVDIVGPTGRRLIFDDGVNNLLF